MSWLGSIHEGHEEVRKPRTGVESPGEGIRSVRFGRRPTPGTLADPFSGRRPRVMFQLMNKFGWVSSHAFPASNPVLMALRLDENRQLASNPPLGSRR